MCLRKKKSKASQKEPKGKSDMGTTPKSRTPHTPLDKPAATKGTLKTAEEAENVVAKPCGDAAAKGEDSLNVVCGDGTVKEKKEPLHIKVPPPRIMKARRVMNQVKEARDPAYKTLEPDMSDWESVRLLKKSEVNLDELVKKDKHIDATQN